MQTSPMPSDRGRFLPRVTVLAALMVSAALACTSQAPPTPTPPPTAAPIVTPSPTVQTTTPPTAFDFGDAPDPAYPSLLISDGARTRVIDQFWLGNLRSPSVTAEADAKVVDRDELDDGLEAYEPFAGQATLTFRAVKSTSAASGVAYFNLLVDLDRDGRWLDGDWVEKNREVDLEPGKEELIEVVVDASIEGTWIRAALTDTPVTRGASGGWEGTGEFAVGEIEDYYLPPVSPPETPSPTPSYTPTPTPTETPTPSEGVTFTPGPTIAPSPTFVYTGDFVVVCEPNPAGVVHGESVEIALRLTSGEHTPPERFNVRVAGGESAGGGISAADPPAAEDGWSDWQDGSTVTFTSTHVDPPPRIERTVVVVILQSLSTTRELLCEVRITHTEPSPSPGPTQAFIPTIAITPETVTLSAVSSVSVNVDGMGFKPGGEVVLEVTAPNGHRGTLSTNADTQGRVHQPVQIPPGSPRGVWGVVATDSATGASAEDTFRVS